MAGVSGYLIHVDPVFFRSPQSLDAHPARRQVARVTDRLVPFLRGLRRASRVARPAGWWLLALAGAGLTRGQTAGTNYFWSTLAGTAGAATLTRVDGPATLARFYWPYGVAVDGAGNVFVADSYNHSIRKITLAGAVSTVAGATSPGFEDGAGATVRFNTPEGLAVDSAGNIFVADTFNHVIRKITAAGVVTTIAGQPASPGFADGTAGFGRLSFPRGVVPDGAGNLYVTDSRNHIIRKIDASGAVTTVAGSPTNEGSNDGNSSSARFSQPWGLAIDGPGNLFVADYGNSTIRRITAAGVVSTVAGLAGSTGSTDGIGSAARFSRPAGVAVDRAGNLFVADAGIQIIRKIAPGGVVTTIGGKAEQSGSTDGLTGTALFSSPFGIAVDLAGTLYVADQANSTIRSGVVPLAPVIAGQPPNLTVTAGVGATFSVVATSLVSVTYQWLFNGTPIAGATAATYSVASAQAKDAGNYSVVVTNVTGSTTSPAATLTVSAPPVIATAPSGTIIGAGGTAQLTVSAVGSGALTYQWLRDGVPVAGATNATFTAEVPGAYAVVVANTFGSVTSATVRVELPNRLVNLSTRGAVGTGNNALVAGLVVSGAGTATKALLIRGIGPTLANFGVEGAVAQTAINVVDSRGVTLASNQGWFNNSNLAQLVDTTRAAGAFALTPPTGPSGGGDSALLVNLAPGSYTVTVGGVGGAVGNGLVEVYEVGADNSRLVNLSTRGQVSAAGGLTAGVVVQGTTSTRLLVRAAGPALTQFGVTSALARPQLTFYNGSRPIAINAGWGVATNGSTPGEITAAAAAIGAFPFAAGSDDAALVVTLVPGSYTAQVSGVGGATGVALIEVYQVP